MIVVKCDICGKSNEDGTRVSERSALPVGDLHSVHSKYLTKMMHICEPCYEYLGILIAKFIRDRWGKVA